MLQAVLTGESRSVSKIWRRRLSSGAARSYPLGRVLGKAGSRIPSLPESCSGNANRISSGGVAVVVGIEGP